MRKWETGCMCGWTASAYNETLLIEAYETHARLFPDHISVPPYRVEGGTDGPIQTTSQ